MPGFDRTGPRGMGPMTGGARGLCNPRGTRRAYTGRGFGFRGASPGWPYIGRGRGGLARGWYPGLSRRLFTYPAFPVEAYQESSREELDYLKEQSRAMKQDMEAIERRIQELEKED
jgi:hypothetical protein